MVIQPRAGKRVALAAVCGLAAALSGCGAETFPIAFPEGTIGLAERRILIRAFGIMMVVVIPVFAMTFWFAWRYRAKDGKGRYDPNWESNRVDVVIWFIPAAIVLAVAIHVWIFTHALDPYKAIPSTARTLEVQVVAQDWKWLFIYPEQGIASVNELAFPSGAPLALKLTSDTVMNSFFIPALGGQIYAMAGMQTRLNLIADRPGAFRGRNTQYSGDGFADQNFTARAMSSADFDAWVERARQSGKALDATAYAALAEPSSKHPVTYYSSVAPGLYGGIIARYDSGAMHGAMAAE